MKRSTKAMLLSGLVFPGAGHFYLQRWIEGVVLSGVATYALYIIVSVVLNTALEISAQIESGAIAADVGAITAVVTQRPEATQSATNLATIVLTACWIIGIAASYWQGRETEASNEL